MNVKVVKFGGSSLADAEQIKKAAAIIKNDNLRKYIVVSAPGKRSSGDTKVTDLLYKCYELAFAGSNDYGAVLDQIKERFADIISELKIDFELEKEIEVIREHLKNCPQKDYMASRGEYLNAKIIAAYLDYPFLDTASLIRFGEDGSLNEFITNINLRTAVGETEKAVFPGFYGSDENGTVKTFSRGGSDVTGSLVAQAACAVLYENWTDVSGLMFTDPRIVDDPKTIDYITYRELRELSYMGASVLHEDAVFPVRKAGIPINIRNTNRPDDAGTMIVGELPASAQIRHVTGIAGHKGFTSITIEQSMMNSEVGFGAKLLEIFAEHGIPFEHCPTGIDTMSVIVNSALFKEKKDEILQQIRSILGPELICVDNGLAMIAVVGHGIGATRGVAAKVFGTLAKAGVNIRMIDQGSSGMNIIVGVEETDYEDAVRSLYREFAEN